MFGERVGEEKGEGERRRKGWGRRGREQGGTCDEVRAVGREQLRAAEEGGQWLAIRIPGAHATRQTVGARSPSLLNKQPQASSLFAVLPHLALLPQDKSHPSSSGRKCGDRTQLIRPSVS